MKATFLSRYTPRLMPAEVLEAVFVQRQELAQKLVEQVQESVLASQKYYILLTGPRGIGKTHLISLLYYRIRNLKELQNHLLIAWLSEEEWSVTSFLDLLLCIFKALQDESNSRNTAQPCPSKSSVESLYELPADEAEKAGKTLLQEFIGQQTLLLLVENLDELFAGLGSEGQKQFYAFLQETPCTIIATATSQFKDITQKKSPFFGFFQHEPLKDLSIEQARQLLANIAKIKENPELESFIQTQTGMDRIKAVHHLAGGNHRLYVIFSEFLTTRESLDQLVDAFMRTLDDLTPYYQERMRFVSPQQRKIIDFLCDSRNAVPVKEIAQRCFMTHQTASSQLKKLLDLGYVHSEPVGRESYYELRESMMRFCLEVKKRKGKPSQLIVDFLKIWYTQSELRQLLKLVPLDAITRQYLIEAIKSDEKDANVRVEELRKEIDKLVEQQEFTQALKIAEELIRISDQAKDWAIKSSILSLLNRWDEALVYSEKAIELKPDNAVLWASKSSILFGLKHYKDALSTCEKAIELDSQDAFIWNLQANILFHLQSYKEALIACDKAIELDANDVWIWGIKANILVNLQRNDEALASCNKIIDLEPNNQNAWATQGLLLSKLGRWQESLTSLNQAIELGSEFPEVFLARSGVLIALQNWDEGVQALDYALKFDENKNNPATELITTATINYLFKSSNEPAIWQSRIKTLFDIYKKHHIIKIIGHGFVKRIPDLMSDMISDKAARTWLEIWQEITGTYPEFEIPLRLVDAAVRYRERKRDRRVLLELPIEERELLQQVLKREEDKLEEKIN